MSVALAIRGIVNYERLDPTQRGYTRFFAQVTGRTARADGRGITRLRNVIITTPSPNNHLSGFVMRTDPPIVRNRSTDSITGFTLDRGIYTRWRFIGSKGSDSLTFAPQGVIISKRNGGTINFGVDDVRDTFTFTNTIDVARCSQKHGFQCSPLNHLSKVRIVNFGRQDIINLQGRSYGWGDVRNGALPGVPVDKLSISLIAEA